MNAFVSPLPQINRRLRNAPNKPHVTSIPPNRTPRYRTTCRSSPASPPPSVAEEWFRAARLGDISQMTRMIRKGLIATALVQRSDDRQTALHAAAAQAEAITVSALFELARGVGGARQDFAHRTDDAALLVNMTDAHGNTPLHLAVARQDDGAPAVVQKLLLLGADLAATNNMGERPMDVVKVSGRGDVVKLLTRY